MSARSDATRQTSSPPSSSSPSSSTGAGSPTKTNCESLRREIESIETEEARLRAELASLRQERKILATVVQSWGKGISVL
ncbi:hypothetical protein DRE_00910 [Drechslerella stenobrocha 248]|uniref:Uncharacterized protein n=1 Tax=Drechslerella stenobrocha 248 TaxID=1043628 RepID=W7HLH5_9PEZI|nr:hypothetical protein DRE_00910 [Drechslerella stenobrocha 248]